jgi:hypothetical protein
MAIPCPPSGDPNCPGNCSECSRDPDYRREVEEDKAELFELLIND